MHSLGRMKKMTRRAGGRQCGGDFLPNEARLSDSCDNDIPGTGMDDGNGLAKGRTETTGRLNDRPADGTDDIPSKAELFKL